MDVRKLLEEVKRGDTSIEEAENAFKNLPYEDLGYAKLDLHRKLRSGFPETVFCQGKPDAYLADIFETLYRENGECTRNAGDARAVESSAGAHPGDRIRSGFKNFGRRENHRRHRGSWKGWWQSAQAEPRISRLRRKLPKRQNFFGCRVERYYDIGVAGIHRLLSKREAIARANCVIAVAGMEGALGTVVAGLVENPVIAVSDLGRLWCKFSWTVGIDHDD